MHHDSIHLDLSRTQRGVTLTELLVTMTVIAALALLTMPAWSKLARSHANNTAASLVMGVLEQARIAATSAQREVWVVFRHAEKGGKDALRIVSRTEDGYAPVGTWSSLPAGVSFLAGTDSVMEERPPATVLSKAIAGSTTAEGSSYGAIMFQRTGRIGIPKRDGIKLAVTLTRTASSDLTTILLSRATGRATLK